MSPHLGGGCPGSLLLFLIAWQDQCLGDSTDGEVIDPVTTSSRKTSRLQRQDHITLGPVRPMGCFCKDSSKLLNQSFWLHSSSWHSTAPRLWQQSQVEPIDCPCHDGVDHLPSKRAWYNTTQTKPMRNVFSAK